jgi:hypothetical protein
MPDTWPSLTLFLFHACPHPAHPLPMTAISNSSNATHNPRCTTMLLLLNAMLFMPCDAMFAFPAMPCDAMLALPAMPRDTMLVFLLCHATLCSLFLPCLATLCSLFRPCNAMQHYVRFSSHATPCLPCHATLLSPCNTVTVMQVQFTTVTMLSLPMRHLQDPLVYLVVHLC